MRVPYKVRMLGKLAKRAWGQVYPEYLTDGAFARCMDADRLGLGAAGSDVREAALRFHRERFEGHCRFFFDRSELPQMRDLLGPAEQAELVATAERSMRRIGSAMGKSMSATQSGSTSSG